MLPSGRVLFGRMDEVVFGKPAAEAIVAQVDRLGKTRVFLMVSNSLNRKRDEIDKIRRALGRRCAGTFDQMPAHTPRAAVIEATEAARAAQADLIVTIGGGSITDGGKAVQMCLANDIRSPEAIDKLRPVRGANGAVGPLKGCACKKQLTFPCQLDALGSDDMSLSNLAKFLHARARLNFRALYLGDQQTSLRCQHRVKLLRRVDGDYGANRSCCVVMDK